MSEQEIFKQIGKCIKTMRENLECIEKMLTQNPVDLKELLSIGPASCYMGTNIWGLQSLLKNTDFPRPWIINGRRYFSKMEMYNWKMSQPPKHISERTKELQKLTILQQQNG